MNQDCGGCANHSLASGGRRLAVIPTKVAGLAQTMVEIHPGQTQENGDLS